MTNKTEFIIDAGGAIVRRDITERGVALSPAALTAIAAGVDRFAPNLTRIHDMSAGLCVSGTNEYYWTVRFKKLPLRAPFRIIEEFMVPQFDSKSDPVHDLQWECPLNMFLFVVMLVSQDVVNAWTCKKCWMVALDDKRIQWQLPLGNLYDDCAICTGVRSGFTDYNQMGAIDKMLTQIEKSEWNADLPKPLDRVHGLFRYKVENSGFVQMPPAGTWQRHCVKVAIPVYHKLAQTDL